MRGFIFVAALQTATHTRNPEALAALDAGCSARKSASLT